MGRTTPPLRNSTPCRPKGFPTLYYFQISKDPKIFLKAPLSPIFTNSEGGAIEKLVKFFQKLPKNAFFGLIFQNFVCGAENLVKMESLQ